MADYIVKLGIMRWALHLTMVLIPTYSNLIIHYTAGTVINFCFAQWIPLIVVAVLAVMCYSMMQV